MKTFLGITILLLLLLSCTDTGSQKNAQTNNSSRISDGVSICRWCYVTKEGSVFQGDGELTKNDPEVRSQELNLLIAKHDGILIVEVVGKTNWVSYCRYRMGKKDGAYIQLGDGDRIRKVRRYEKGSERDGTWWYDNGGLWSNITSNEAGFRVTIWDREGSVWTDGVSRGGKRNGSYASWLYGGEVPYITVISNGNLVNEYRATNEVPPPM